MDTWPSYVRGVTGHARGFEIARRLGISNSKVSHWLGGTRPPSVQDAMALARAYGRPPLEGLVGAGMLTADEIEQHVTVQLHGMADFTDAEIAAELYRRIMARGSEGDATGAASQS